jgi:hypothetical protein
MSPSGQKLGPASGAVPAGRWRWGNFPLGDEKHTLLDERRGSSPNLGGDAHSA